MLLPWSDFLKLFVAAVLGAVIGFEREIHDKPAGFRTHILVSLGSALFAILSVSGFGSNPSIAFDPSRIAAQVLVGVGFIGAGVIISYGGHVKGVTTAADLWVSSAIGMAVGLGQFALGIFAALLTLAILLLKSLERDLKE